MKQLPSVCSVMILAVTVSACMSVPQVENRLESLELGPNTYVVRAGDTLESIAFRYKLTPNELAALNSDKGRVFPPGTHLNVYSPSRSGETYRRENAWVNETPQTGAIRNSTDQAITSAVRTPSAVRDQQQGDAAAYGQNAAQMPPNGQASGQGYAQGYAQGYEEGSAQSYEQAGAQAPGGQSWQNAQNQQYVQGYNNQSQSWSAADGQAQYPAQPQSPLQVQQGSIQAQPYAQDQQGMRSQSVDRTALSPAVSAVVSDVTLLDSTRPYREGADQSAWNANDYAQQPQLASRDNTVSGVPASAQPQTDIVYARQSESLQDRSPDNRGVQSDRGGPNATVNSGIEQSAGASTSWQSAKVDPNAMDVAASYGSQEIVEEEYNGESEALSAKDVDEKLQSMVGRWTWPTQGEVAREFAPQSEGRYGVDIAGVAGQPVVAVTDGVVAYSGRDPSGAGNLIIVRHGDSLLTAYSHTNELFVAENDTVSAGDPIGTLGWNGRQESVLRFEVRRDGNPLNPMDFLSAR